jgi:hypothetical protein
MNSIFLERHARVVSVKGGEKFIVVADDVDDFRSLPTFAQKFLNDIVVFLRPVDAPAQCPDVDEIADKVESVELDILEKFEEDAGFASSRAKVNIGNPAGAITSCHAAGDLSTDSLDK